MRRKPKYYVGQLVEVIDGSNHDIPVGTITPINSMSYANDPHFPYILKSPTGYYQWLREDQIIPVEDN